jgi:hypothetical protein
MNEEKAFESTAELTARDNKKHASKYLGIKRSMIKANQLPYSCINGYQRDIYSVNVPLVILTTTPMPVIEAMGLALDQDFHSRSNTKNHRFKLQCSDDSFKKIILCEKGNGLFPERFESEIMNSRYVKDFYYVPREDHQLLIALYSIVIHRGELSYNERVPIIEHLKNRVGITTRCKYNEFGCHVGYDKPVYRGV